jgi:hypothetical protein
MKKHANLITLSQFPASSNTGLSPSSTSIRLRNHSISNERQGSLYIASEAYGGDLPSSSSSSKDEQKLMREKYWMKRIESIKKYRRREKEKEIEGRS